MQTVKSLDELAQVVADRPNLYIRWSRGPDVDEHGTSRDSLSGAELPGLCANPLAVEAWWGDRDVRLWVARRVYDYRHLGWDKGPDVRAWVLEGDEIGRGPDNEPLVRLRHAVAWVADEVVEEAEQVVASVDPGDWGPLNRSS